jgi:hypothetical protein
MFPKLRRLFRRPTPLRLCPHCRQQTPLPAAVCAHCRQPLPALQSVQIRRSNTTIPSLSLRQKLRTNWHLRRAFWGFIASFSLLLFSVFIAIDRLAKEADWDVSQGLFALTFFGFMTLINFLILYRAAYPRQRGEQLYPEGSEQKWLDKLADKDASE